jgi:predicted permease
VVKLRQEATSFEGFAALRAYSVTLGGTHGTEPLQVPQAAVSSNFFELLGIGPELGRGFAAGEDVPGAPRLAVISHRLFLQRFGADSSLVGKEISLDDRPTTVIGVLPASFRFSVLTSLGPAAGEMDVYQVLTDTLSRMNPQGHSLGLLGRIRPNVDRSAALAELANISRRLDADFYGKQGFRFVPILLQDRMTRGVRPVLLALLAAVAILMLIMGANLAVLALVRAAAREREMTVRRAIGASHGRVGRQILTETLLLSLAGAVVGTLLASSTLKWILTLAPAQLPRRADIGIDFTVLAVALGIALLIGLGMGLAPMVHSIRADISTVLREKAPSRSGGRVRHLLVLGQVALTMMLLAGTGLLLGSFVRLLKVDPGFEPSSLLAIDLQLSRARYQGGPTVANAFARYADALEAIPGVTAVSASGALPLSAGADQNGAWFPGSPTNTGKSETDFMLVDVAPVTEGYFATTGIPLLAGEEFTAANRDSAFFRVAIIDDLLAKRFFPGGQAVGQIAIVDGDTARIVGVARHVRMYSLEEEGRPQIWVPHGWVPYRRMSMAVRTSGDPAALIGLARAAIRQIDPEQVIIEMSPMSERVSQTLAERRLALLLVGTFAGSALLLAALGVYGVTASGVTQRTRELGLRMALGATRRTVVGTVLSEPARLVTFGLAIGLAGTALAARLVRRLLYGISPLDPVTLVGVAVVLFAVTIVATYLPARRAIRVDPMVALRSD